MNNLSRFLALASILCVPLSSRGTVVFTETFGNLGGGSETIANYGGYSSSELTFSGTGTIEPAGAGSSNYSGASGDRYAKLTGNKKTLIISDINTSAFNPYFTLTIGAYKSLTSSTLADKLKLSYTTADGSVAGTIDLPAQPTGDGTANWTHITISNLFLPQTASLTLRWDNFAGSLSSTYFGLDDIQITGTLASVPEASGLFCGAVAAAMSCLAWRKRARASARAA